MAFNKAVLFVFLLFYRFLGKGCPNSIMGISLSLFGELFLFSSGVDNIAAGRGELVITGGF